MEAGLLPEPELCPESQGTEECGARHPGEMGGLVQSTGNCKTRGLVSSPKTWQEAGKEGRGTGTQGD